MTNIYADKTKKDSMTIAEFQKWAARGNVFTVKFTKRSTGEEREMNCRCGVMKHAKGGTLNYDPKEKLLLPVFDMQNQGYRSISLDSLISLNAKGRKYTWDVGQQKLVEA